jgi:hypothetical membrane protein
MSELGEAGAPYALVMNAGFMLLGLLMIVFAFALHGGIGEGSKIGPALVAFAGISLVMVAFFPCDPGCIDISVTGTLHSITATISAIAMVLGVLAISQRLHNDDTLRRYSKYSQATGIVAGIVSLLLFSAAFEKYMGAIQRISMAVPLLWMEVMTIQLFRLGWSSNNPCC